MVAPRASSVRTPEIELSLRLEDNPPLFANLLTVQINSEEFLLTVAFVNPEEGRPARGSVLGRFVLTPAHARRVVQALAEQVARYESLFGSLQQEPDLSIVNELGH